MITLLCTLALAETTTIGGDSDYNDNGNMLKLVEVSVSETAVVTALEFAVYNYRSDGDVYLVAYEADGDQFVLLDAVEAEGLPDEGQGWAKSGELAWVLEQGKTYAIGAYVGGDWYYYYQDDRTEQPWFGRVTASYQVEGRAPPDAFQPDEAENHYYYMQVSSEDPDADDDGFLAVDYGGADCDDADAAVGEPSEEIPGDGIDQDCDGADLPLDEEPADTAGNDPKGGGGGGAVVDASTCSCDGGAGAAGAWAVAGVLALARARARLRD